MGKHNKPEVKQGVIAMNSFPGQSAPQDAAPAAPAEETVPESVEAKQGVITSADVKSGKRFRIAGLRGGFGRTHFDDDFVTSKTVDEETEAQLRDAFGDAVEVVE